jgi:hypothetical protein
MPWVSVAAKLLAYLSFVKNDGSTTDPIRAFPTSVMPDPPFNSRTFLDIPEG